MKCASVCVGEIEREGERGERERERERGKEGEREFCIKGKQKNYACLRDRCRVFVFVYVCV